MWVTFARDFDFSPSARGGRVTLAYKAGTRHNVTRECAELAEAARAIEPVGRINSDADEAHRGG